MPGTPSLITWMPWWTCRAGVSCPGLCPLSRTPCPQPGPCSSQAHTPLLCRKACGAPGKQTSPFNPVLGRHPDPWPLLTQLAPGNKTQKGPSQLQSLEPGSREGGRPAGSEKPGLSALDSFWGLIQALLGSAGGLVTASH